MDEIWNAWHGCRKISEGCQHCYMFRRDASVGKDGAVVAETHSGMSRSNYINIMVRFDQGMFENLRVQRDMSFQDLRDIAQADADYGDETSSGTIYCNSN